ncbi:hypothetical protein [Actinoplanes friuliensis]|uniref:Uncharacterized protein n=1 Tax=Actinoplanes friuliensis DSM 7358 TaxID=1246995 RepID=U5W6V1_9ACTN|nr:hypothetical protein [Actinoplanes friuliensis]AGZ44732.1 hypothetical protein AFR_32370 [Actinoplanes friuliensis DSM 7358]
MGLSRNRWILAAGVTGTAAAVVVAGAVAANAAQEQPKPRPSASAPAAPSTEDAPPVHAKLGKVVETGFAAKKGTWVIYAVPVDMKEVPGTHFGVMVGLKKGTAIEDVIVANETVGSDKAPGFHGVSGSMDINGEKNPAFGYYVGDATKITAKAGKRTVVASQAAWSEDAAVKFFWFDPKTADVSDLEAYDSAGRKLPGGNNTVSVG